MRTFAALTAFGLLATGAMAQQVLNPATITLRHDFNTVPTNVPPNGPFTLGDATFSEASTGTGGPGWRLISVFPASFGRQLTDNAGISNITITFAQPMIRAGLNVGIGADAPNNSTYRVEFFAGATPVGAVSQSVTGVDGNFFAGWQSNLGITRVVITEPSGENGRVGGIDDVRYDVIPAPSAMALLGLGGIAALRRRR